MNCTGKSAGAAALIASVALYLVPTTAAQVTVSVESAPCAPGGTAVAWVTLENAAGVTGADLSLHLPDFAVPGPAETTAQAAGFLVASRARPGQVDLAIASLSGLAVDRAVILGVPFTLDRAAEPGSYSLTIDRLQLYDSTPSPVMSQAIAGTLAVPPPPADRDADGLPDDWETLFYGNTEPTGEGDLDLDGVSDAMEFIAGTDAANFDSVFAIDQVAVENREGQVALRWVASQGRTYQIEWTDDLLGPDMTWRQVYNPLIQIDPAGAQWIDDGSRTYRLPALSHQRFYRIRITMP